MMAFFYRCRANHYDDGRQRRVLYISREVVPLSISHIACAREKRGHRREQYEIWRRGGSSSGVRSLRWRHALGGV